MKLLIKNGKIVSRKATQVYDILISDGIIADVGQNIVCEDADRVIDAEGLCVSSGFTDLIARASEPQSEGREDMISLSYAAAKGGFTTVCLHAGIDSLAKLQEVIERGKYCACEMLPAVRATANGELLHYGDFKLFSAIAAYDDEPISSPLLMRDALFRARKYGVPLFSRCKDLSFYNGGIARKGIMAELMDIPFIPAAAESVMVARDVVLAADTGSHVHIANISTKESVGIIRRAKAEKVPVTCSTAPHYLSLLSRELFGFNTLAKVDPPLGNKEDAEALVAAALDGTIDAICSDHDPQTDAAKRKSLLSAPYGASSVELAFPALLTELYHKRGAELSKVIGLLTDGPCGILGIEPKKIRAGENADLCIFDPDYAFKVRGSQLISKGHNTPFEGKELRGLVLYTIKDGRVSFETGK